MLLVQCHPEIGESDEDFHAAELPHDIVLAPAVIEAFESGWKRLLDS
jgi:hypothetical protein